MPGLPVLRRCGHLLCSTQQLLRTSLLDLFDVVRGQVCSYAEVAHQVAGLMSLGCGVDGDLCDHFRGDLGEGPGDIAATPWVRRDLVGPGMFWPSRGEERGELDRLGGGEGTGAADNDQLAVFVILAGDHDLRAGNRAEHAAHDNLPAVAVPDFDPDSGTAHIPGGGALGHETLNPHLAEGFEPELRFSWIISDWCELQRRSPGGCESCEALPANVPALGAQVDPGDREQVERDVRRGILRRPGPGGTAAGRQAALQRVEAEPAVDVRDDLAVEYDAFRDLADSGRGDVGERGGQVGAVAGPQPRLVTDPGQGRAAS